MESQAFLRSDPLLVLRVREEECSTPRLRPFPPRQAGQECSRTPQQLVSFDATLSALFGGAVRFHFHEVYALTLTLVSEHIGEGVLRRRCRITAVTRQFQHPLHVEVFDRHQFVLPSVVVREFVQEITPLVWSAVLLEGGGLTCYQLKGSSSDDLPQSLRDSLPPCSLLGSDLWGRNTRHSPEGGILSLYQDSTDLALLCLGRGRQSVAAEVWDNFLISEYSRMFFSGQYQIHN